MICNEEKHILKVWAVHAGISEPQETITSKGNSVESTTQVQGNLIDHTKVAYHSLTTMHIVTLHHLKVVIYSIVVMIHVLCVTGMNILLWFVNLAVSIVQHWHILLCCKLLLFFMNMQLSVIQITFIVETYIIHRSY